MGLHPAESFWHGKLQSEQGKLQSAAEALSVWVFWVNDGLLLNLHAAPWQLSVVGKSQWVCTLRKVLSQDAQPLVCVWSSYHSTQTRESGQSRVWQWKEVPDLITRWAIPFALRSTVMPLERDRARDYLLPFHCCIGGEISVLRGSFLWCWWGLLEMSCQESDTGNTVITY